MLLSEVHVGEGRGGAGGAAAEPLPSSRVQLNDGRVVNVTGNVSRAGESATFLVVLEHRPCMYLACQVYCPSPVHRLFQVPCQVSKITIN